MAVLARTRSGVDDEAIWMRCMNCRQPVTAYRGYVNGAPLPLREPMGLPDVEASAWWEARACLSVGAYTASVMMCRKILLHVAVTHGLQPIDANGRSPAFVQAIDHLEKEGLVTKIMRPWVERIKQVGNQANHELAAIGAADAFDVSTFTLQLLVLTFEMPAIMSTDFTSGRS
jgi:hypothetical protein